MERQFYQSDMLQKHLKPFYALLIIALFSMLPGIFIIHRASPAVLPIYMLNGFLVVFILILFKFGLKSKQNKPFIIIDDDTFTIFPGFISFLSKRSVRWKELKGFYRTRLDFSSWPLKNKGLEMVRLVTQSNKTVVSFGLQYVEQGEELLVILRERITDLTALEHEEFFHAGD